MAMMPIEQLERCPHLAEALAHLDPQQRRRLEFIRAERLSASEAADLPGDFDPGLEYEPATAAHSVS